MRSVRCGSSLRTSVPSPTADFLARAELLAACGETVLITDYFDYYRLAAYIAERTTERTGRRRTRSSRPWTTSRSGPSSSRCTTTWPAGAAS